MRYGASIVLVLTFLYSEFEDMLLHIFSYFREYFCSKIRGFCLYVTRLYDSVHIYGLSQREVQFKLKKVLPKNWCHQKRYLILKFILLLPMDFVHFKFVWIPFDWSQTKSIESRFDVTLSTFLTTSRIMDGGYWFSKFLILPGKGSSLMVFLLAR